MSNATIATAVTGYYPEGQRLIACTINPAQCFFSNNVYVAKSRSIYIFNNNNNTLGAAIYTSVDTTAVVYGLTTDFSRLFFFERRQGSPCSPFCPTIHRGHARNTQRQFGRAAVYFRQQSAWGSAEPDQRRHLYLLG